MSALSARRCQCPHPPCPWPTRRRANPPMREQTRAEVARADATAKATMEVGKAAVVVALAVAAVRVRVTTFVMAKAMLSVLTVSATAKGSAMLGKDEMVEMMAVEPEVAIARLQGVLAVRVAAVWMRLQVTMKGCVHRWVKVPVLAARKPL